MNREIVFRGKRIDNGQWVAGFYCTNPEWDRKTYGEHHWIISGKNGIKYEVDPATVGQYTGLKDKNGKRIFEGDIVDILTENEEIGVVEYEDGGFLVSADGFCVDFHANINGTDLDVIGNKWDNSEWLEVR